MLQDIYIPPQLVGFGFGWIEATAPLLGVEDPKQKETMKAAEQMALKRLLPYMAHETCPGFGAGVPRA